MIMKKPTTLPRPSRTRLELDRHTIKQLSTSQLTEVAAGLPFDSQGMCTSDGC
jgi:hypothetical protein